MKILKEQILSTKKKTDHLISNISEQHWLNTPDVLNTNLNWQIGHIILANYLQGVASITGPNLEVKEQINVPNYIKYYGPNSNPKDFLTEKPSTKELLDIYELMFSIILSNLDQLNEIELNKATVVPNPSVSTKYEALKWLSHHQSWHNGQIAILARIFKK